MTLVKSQEPEGVVLPRSVRIQGTKGTNLGHERAVNGLPTAQWCGMGTCRRWALAWLWVGVSVLPASAQTDGIGGSSEFRAADRPISAPTLGGLDEAKSSDLVKLLSPGGRIDVLKQIGDDLARTRTRSAVDADVSRRDSTAKVGDRPNQRGLEGSTFR